MGVALGILGIGLLVVGAIACSAINGYELLEEEIQKEKIAYAELNLELLDTRAVAADLKAALIDLKAHCSVFPLTLEERKYVEQVVMSEAGNQPFEGQCAVAQAIRDRHRMWGQSIHTVLSAPSQFACNPKWKVTPEVRAAVSYIFDEGKSTFKDPVTHFHTLDINPSWAKTKTYMGSIGNHKFYY